MRCLRLISVVGLIISAACTTEPADRPLDAAALWRIDSAPEVVIGDNPDDTTVVVDRGDNLWVRSFPRSDTSVVRWVVFSHDGKEIGSVDLPGTLEVHDIGPDWILGIEVSLDDGSQQVVKYRLHRQV